MTSWNIDENWTYGAIDKYFDILFEYMHFKMQEEYMEKAVEQYL